MHPSRCLALLACSLLLITAGCQSDDPGRSQVTSRVSLSLDMSAAPAGVVGVQAQLTRAGYTPQNLALTVSGATADGSFSDVAVGLWHLRVDALDGLNALLYTGQTDVDVQPGGPTNVDLVLNPANGGIVLHVHWGAGAAGNALRLDGVNDYARALDSASLDNVTGALTLEAWVRPYYQWYNTVISKGSKNYTFEFCVGLRPGFMFRGVTPDYSGAENYYGRLLLYNELMEEQWQHVAMTWSEAAGISVYVNGEPIYARPATGAIQPLSDELWIGARVDPNYREYFRGDLDDVRVWNVVRSAAEIHANYNHVLTGTEPGLVAYWKFDEAPGATTALDATPNHNDATLENGALLVTSGAF